MGTASDNKITPTIAASFLALCELADFEGEIPEREEVNETLSEAKYPEYSRKLGLSYTINLNLPATTDIEVFNAIFKALKENLLI